MHMRFLGETKLRFKSDRVEDASVPDPLLQLLPWPQVVLNLAEQLVSLALGGKK